MLRLSLKSFQALIGAMALIWAPVACYPETAFAQGPKTPRGALYYCMKATFPEFRLGSDANRGFDPQSGRNFAFENGRWIDVKTGEAVCPGATGTGPKTMRGALHYCMKATFSEFQLGSDANRGFDPRSGRNFAFENGRWIDIKTGKSVCPESSPAIAQQPQTDGQVGSVPPLKLDPSEKLILDVHNAERVAVGVPPLRWNPQLEATATAWAQELARTGQLVHAPREGRRIERENLSQGNLWWGPEQMMSNWLREKRNFIPGLFPDVARDGNWLNVAHYTQMIWPTTTDLGCGEAAGSGYKWLVCRYSPGGNKDGKPVGLPQPSFGVGPARTGLDVNVTSGSSGGRGNDVNLDASTNVLIDQLFKDPAAYQWIDIKTGKPVLSWPVDSKGQVIQPSIGNPNSAHDPETGQNLARENGVWIDIKTGKPVLSWPVDSKGQVIQPSIGNPNSAYDPETGRNFAREPVPAKPAATPATQPAGESQTKPERGQ